jgi:hypothetical protein
MVRHTTPHHTTPHHATPHHTVSPQLRQPLTSLREFDADAKGGPLDWTEAIESWREVHDKTIPSDMVEVIIRTFDRIESISHGGGADTLVPAFTFAISQAPQNLVSIREFLTRIFGEKTYFGRVGYCITTFSVRCVVLQGICIVHDLLPSHFHRIHPNPLP